MNQPQSLLNSQSMPLRTAALLSTMAAVSLMHFPSQMDSTRPRFERVPGVMLSSANRFTLEFYRPDREVADLNRLAERWRYDTRFTSSLTDMIMHPAYQEIIAAGQEAIPFLMSELQRSPDHWFWALHKITGENPVSDEDSGDLEKMTAAWLDWGRQNGFI